MAGIFVVFSEEGEYDSYVKTNVCACLDEEAAFVECWNRNLAVEEFNAKIKGVHERMREWDVVNKFKERFGTAAKDPASTLFKDRLAHFVSECCAVGIKADMLLHPKDEIYNYEELPLL